MSNNLLLSMLMKTPVSAHHPRKRTPVGQLPSDGSIVVIRPPNVSQATNQTPVGPWSWPCRGRCMHGPTAHIAAHIVKPQKAKTDSYRTSMPSPSAVTEVMTLRVDTPLPEAFQLLFLNGFHSAPVTDGPNYVGFIDLAHMMRYAISLFWQDTSAVIWSTLLKESRFARTTVGDVMSDWRSRDPHITHTIWNPNQPYPMLPHDTTTFMALEVFARTDVQRIGVQDASGRLVSILTESMLISWLSRNPNMLGDVGFRQVATMKASELVTVFEEEYAINAFNTMLDKHVDGLAVITKGGVLVAGISNTDLRGIGLTGEHFTRLLLPISDFKRLVKDDYPSLADSGTPQRAIYVRPQQVLKDVIRYMRDGNIHRVFVCSEGSCDAQCPQPIATITQKDVLRTIFDSLICKKTVKMYPEIRR